jgi:hypothetical protein
MAVNRIALKVERNPELHLPISVSEQRVDVAKITTVEISADFRLLELGLGDVVFDSRG